MKRLNRFWYGLAVLASLGILLPQCAASGLVSQAQADVFLTRTSGSCSNSSVGTSSADAVASCSDFFGGGTGSGQASIFPGVSLIPDLMVATDVAGGNSARSSASASAISVETLLVTGASGAGSITFQFATSAVLMESLVGPGGGGTFTNILVAQGGSLSSLDPCPGFGSRSCNNRLVATLPFTFSFGAPFSISVELDGNAREFVSAGPSRFAASESVTAQFKGFTILDSLGRPVPGATVQVLPDSNQVPEPGTFSFLAAGIIIFASRAVRKLIRANSFGPTEQ